MKPLHIDRSIPLNQSFCIQHLKKRDEYLTVWHYHKEIELVVVMKGMGTRFVGNNISRFEKGDVVLLGKNTPHLWMFDDFKNKLDTESEIFVVHLDPKFYELSAFPEMGWIKELFQISRKGIYFDKVDHLHLASMMKTNMDRKPFHSFIGLVKILEILVSCESKVFLSTQSHFFNDEKNNSRLDPVYEYIFSNFRNQITLQDCSKLACMNPSSFSRYFKRTQGKTLTSFISEIRIGYAAKLMLENDMRISEICFESGFNNISSFNKQFRNVMKVTPRVYISTHRVQALV